MSIATEVAIKDLQARVSTLEQTVIQLMAMNQHQRAEVMHIAQAQKPQLGLKNDKR